MDTTTPTAPILAAADAQAEHARTLAALRERVKELDCLYEITRLSQRQDLPLAGLLAGACTVVARAWQYPKAACVRLSLGGQTFATPNWRRPVHRQESVLAVDGEAVGRIEVGYLERLPAADEGPFLREERHLLDALADHLGRIISMRRAEERLRQLSLERIKAEETERQRIARELHDDVAQHLSLARMGLDRLLAAMTAEAGPESRDLVRDCAARLGAALASLRNLAGDLLPPALDRLGLAEAAAALCRDTAARTGLAVEFSADGLATADIGFDAALNVYRVLQEGLANACRHGRCSRIVVRLIASHPLLLLRLADDGQGFDPNTRLPEALAEKRLGLWSMGERVRLLGGRLTISSRPGRGTRIKAEIPLAEVLA
jgi:signal transduction histidine kinase